MTTETVSKPKRSKDSSSPTSSEQSQKPKEQPSPKWAAPTLGLSRVLGQSASGPETEPESEHEGSERSWNEKEESSEHVLGEDGEVIGQEDTTEHTVGKGIRGESESKTSSFDGATKKTTESSSEGLLGAQAMAKRINTWTPEKATKVLEAGAKAGAFGSSARKVALERGGASLNAEGKVEGGMGAEAGVEMSGTVTRDELGELKELEATIEAFAKIGVWGKAEAEVEAKYGIAIAKAKAELEAWAGAQAEFSGAIKASFDQGEFSAEFKAEAKAGAGASASGEASLDLGVLGLAVEGKAEAFAGAEASAEGKFVFGVSGVSIQFAASAFAGARASAEGAASIRIMGRTVLKASGKVEVSAGVGGEIGGEFTIEGGKVKFSAALSAALGVGAGAAADVEADFGAVAEVLAAAYEEMAASDDDKAILDTPPDYKREPLKDVKAGKKHEKFAYDTLYPDFLAYAHKKSTQGKNGLKQDRIQEIIKNAGPTLRPHIAFVETDTGIDRAAKDAFGPMLTSFKSEAGRVIEFEEAAGDAVKQHKTDMKQEEKWRQVRDPLHADFITYAQELESTKGATVDNARLLKIIKKHKSKLDATFPGEQDAVVKWCMQDFVGTFLTSVDQVDVAKGIIAVTPMEGGAAKAQEKYEQGLRGNALKEMVSQLDAVAAELRSNPEAAWDAKALAKANAAITPAYQKLPAGDETKKDAEVKKLVLRPFKGILQDVVLVGGVIRGVDQVKGWRATLNAEADQKKEDASIKAAKDSFTAGLRAYAEQKTEGGQHSIKMNRVQELVTKAAAKAPKWVTSKDGAAVLVEAAKEVLGDALGVLVISGGVVEKMTINETKFGQRKADRAKFGKAVLGEGENLDPRRRQLVANNLRAPLAAYRKELDGVGAKAVPTKDRLQGIITKALTAIGADILGASGGEAIADSIKRAFPEVTTISVDRLEIGEFTATSQQAQGAARARKEALGFLTDKLKTLAKPTPAAVQKALDKGTVMVLNALEPAEADELIAQAIVAAFGEAVSGVTVKNKRVAFTAKKGN